MPQQKDTLVTAPATRRAFLKCSAWAGAGVVWTVAGGVPVVSGLLDAAPAAAATKGVSFVQISDTHIGFDKAANPDPAATANEALAKIAALPHRPDFLIHTGDLTHLATAAQFDAGEQIIASSKLDAHFVPGEHDILDEATAKAWADRFSPRSNGLGWGWYSFDHGGVHFIGLVNVVERKAKGAGSLGAEQLDWLAKDLYDRKSSTPIVVFSHIPMWSVYSDWGWNTADSEQALTLLRKFGSVTLLNGHIHQVIQKVEGNLTFHAGRSTAYPQPEPGAASSPGPVVLPADRLRTALGISSLTWRKGDAALAVTDTVLA